MKAALCLSGQPRFFENGYEYFKKNLLDLNPGIDVFLHFWFDPEEVGGSYVGAPWTDGRTGSIRPDTVDALCKLYNPKAIHPQKQVKFIPVRDYSCRQAKTPTEILLSLHYSIHRANQLRQEYEKQHGFQYDWVIRGRYDYALMTPVVLSNYPNDCINFPDDIPPPRANDQFAFGSSQNMNIYADFYNHMDECWCESNSVLMAGEDLLGYYLYRYGKISPTPIEYRLIRSIATQFKEISI